MRSEEAGHPRQLSRDAPYRSCLGSVGCNDIWPETAQGSDVKQAHHVPNRVDRFSQRRNQNQGTPFVSNCSARKTSCEAHDNAIVSALS